MKKVLLSILLLSSGFMGFSQTSCVRFFDVLNNGGGGACPATFGGNGIQGADNNYKRDGLVELTFTAALGAGITPVITAIREVTSAPGDPVTTGPNLDIRFNIRQFSADRTSAEFCFFSPSNINLFSGANARYQVDVTYQLGSGTTSTSCVIIDEPDPSALPVKFESFNANRSNTNVTLTWSTSSEINNSGFNVQKLINSEWKNIGFVPSKAVTATSGIEMNYNYSDPNNDKSLSQYRIQQVDMDGRFGYSTTRTVKGVGMQKKTMIFPNPGINGKINVVFEDNEAMHDVDVVNSFGQLIKQYKSAINTLQIDNLISGFYILKITEKISAVSSQYKVVVK